MAEYVLKSGELDRRLTILKFGTAADSYGDDRPGYTEAATVSAKQRPSPGSERFSSAQTGAIAPMVFTVRWSSLTEDISPKDRVRCDGVEYDVRSVSPLGRRVALEIIGDRRAD
ncbi:phage head closure protein [Sphingomonas sp. 1P06PA]|uniref:phage head closure protein n=1 Tax=Sphingomonas sp. 1P06PA TaxID=554121 RepID=UPI0039A4E590